MKTFENIKEFIVPSDICDQSDWQLRDAGRDRKERFLLWSGVVDRERFLVKNLHVPKQTAYSFEDGLCVHVEADELHRLNVWLYNHSELLGVQVHSHPTEAYHSSTDDSYPMVTTLGGLSLVVPNFGEFGVRGQATALYRLTLGGWKSITASDASRLLQLTR